MRYRVKIFTGPTEVKERAAFARDDVLAVVEGTEHLLIDVEAKGPDEALEMAKTEAGYTDVRRDLGDKVLFEVSA